MVTNPVVVGDGYNVSAITDLPFSRRTGRQTRKVDKQVERNHPQADRQIGRQTEGQIDS